VRAVALLALGVVATACGGDDEGPSCEAMTVVVTRPDRPGMPFTYASASYAFVNAFGGNGTLDVELAGGGALHLEWPELVAGGGTVEARGWFRVTAGVTAIDVGNCDTSATFGGEMTVDGDGQGGRFVLRDLHSAPYCSGASITGELSGCFRD
jgi:hypothetical protein